MCVVFVVLCAFVQWGESNVLHNISMRVEYRSLTAVVGSVAAGKSSLISALLVCAWGALCCSVELLWNFHTHSLVLVVFLLG